MDSQGGGEPKPKRVRRNHEVNQPAKACHCRRCDGKVTQKPSTIRDHRKRYPRLPDPAPAPAPENNAPGDDGGPPHGLPLGGGAEMEHIEHQPAPSFPNHPPVPSRPATPAPSRPVTPAGNQQHNDNHGVDDIPEAAPHGEEHGNPGSAPPTPRRHRRPPRQPNVNPDGGEDLPEDPDEQLYPFDQLLGNNGWRGDGDPHAIPFAGFGEDDEDDFGGLGQGEGLGDPAEDFDDDLGLPPGNDPPAPPPYQFQLPVDPPEPDEDPDDPIEFNRHCSALEEPAAIRNVYVDAFIQKIVFGATHRALSQQLKNAHRSLSLNPDIPAEDLGKMARTIRTVEKRLGIDFDGLITTYTLCPKCGRRYSPEEIAERDDDDNSCVNNDCIGILFTKRSLATGSMRRVSCLTFPFASPIAWIQHMLLLAGISELTQNWRTETDDREHTDPIDPEEWMANVNVLESLCDMCTGHGWRSTLAGLERTVDQETGEVQDSSPLDPPLRYSSLPWGISLSMNTDWFQPTKENNYSVGAVYLVINNLPRHLRFLREHICLAIVMPGPKEPNDYALDQMMGPLVDELLQLKQGVMMTIRQGSPPVYTEQYVHAELIQHIADLIARIKMGGGAGVKSERNFCLYCRTRLSSISVPAGYMRQDFQFRDPQEDLNNAYFWKSLETEEERRAFFDFTGNKFTSLHRIPGWHTATHSPPDAMHLFYLGGMNWILKQVLVAPGMLNKRHPNDQDPVAIFNRCLDEMWVPNCYQWLPPKATTRDKADQLKLCSNIIPVPLFLAMRDGDSIAAGVVPRGRANTNAAKTQTARAKLLFRERCKYFNSIGQLELCPASWEDCLPSRNLSFHYMQVMRYGLAVNTLDRHSITPEEVGFGQQLLERLCIDYTRANVPLSPNFHYMMHLEEFMLQSGSIYNTHVWAMERANGTLVKINHNGRSGGVLEGTLMRGWWCYGALQHLLQMLQSLPNRTPADNEVIQDIITALKSKSEGAQNQGSLMALIADTRTVYTRLHGTTEPTVLSNQSRVIDLDEAGIYRLVLSYCRQVWPDAGIFGPGMVEQVYLPPVGMVRNFSWVERDGLRYGSYLHTSGKGFCYGFIDGRQAVRIDRILDIDIPGDPHLRTVLALVRRFQPPRVQPEFPWDAWAVHYGISSWEFNSLSELVAIPVTRFSGHLALFQVPMSYGNYWITVSLDRVSPERDEGGNGGEA